MKITPRIPDEKVNYRQYSHLAEFAWLVGTIAFIVSSGYYVAGYAVDWVAEHIPQEREREWFPTETIARSVVTTNLVHSPKLQNLLDKLQLGSQQVTFPLRSYISDSKEPNAFAIPGGAVVVTQGLLEAVKSENELSMVLGHEIGHFVHRHHLRSLGRSIIRLFFSSMLGMAEGAQQVADASLELSSLTYSRDQEHAADEIGLQLVEKRFGHIAGAADFFERMVPLDSNVSALKYFSTHPFSADRVEKIRELGRREGYKVDGQITRLGSKAFE